MYQVLNQPFEPQWQRDLKYPELRPVITRSLDTTKNLISSRAQMSQGVYKPKVNMNPINFSVQQYRDTLNVNDINQTSPEMKRGVTMKHIGRQLNPMSPKYEYPGRDGGSRNHSYERLP